MKKKFRILYYLFASLSWIGLLAPITVWICLNLDKYFVQKNGLSVSMGGVLAFLFIVLLLKYGIKKFGPVFWTGLLFLIFYCLESIIKDAVPLSFFAFIGTLCYAMFSLPKKHFRAKLMVYTDEEIRQDARNKPTVKVTYKGNGR